METKNRVIRMTTALWDSVRKAALDNGDTIAEYVRRVMTEQTKPRYCVICGSQAHYELVFQSQAFGPSQEDLFASIKAAQDNGTTPIDLPTAYLSVSSTACIEHSEAIIDYFMDRGYGACKIENLSSIPHQRGTGLRKAVPKSDPTYQKIKMLVEESPLG